MQILNFFHFVISAVCQSTHCTENVFIYIIWYAFFFFPQQYE